MTENPFIPKDVDEDTAISRVPSGLVKPVVWMFVGAVAAIAAGFTTGIVSWPESAREHEESRKHPNRLWTCGMHPEVLQAESGICPICHMDLTPLDTAVSDGTKHSHADEGEGHWACPMHPDMKDTGPGSCPICGMELEEQSPEPGENQAGIGPAVHVPPAVVQRMNLRTQTVERSDLSRTIRTVGHLQYDERRRVSVTTLFSGFVEKVHVNAVGERVQKGDPLFEVYSPELVQTQQELLLASDYARNLSAADPEARSGAASLLEAARQRLASWNVSQAEIADIESSGHVHRRVTVRSPISGVVTRRIPGLEGMAVQPGLEAVHIADLSVLWLTVEVYEHQLPWLEAKEKATVTFEALPGATFTGRVRVVEPEVSPATRTVKLTLTVPNRDRRLRVGMYATVKFQPVVVSDTVIVPDQAILRTGTRNLVVLEREDGLFEPRQITLGMQADTSVEVTAGLDGGETLVTSAQFLIDSESNLRAAVERMVAAAHEHGR